MYTLKRLASLWLPVLALLTVNFHLSSQSSESLVLISSAGMGKPLHFWGYLLLGFAVLRALNGGFRRLSSEAAVWALFLTTIWAGFDEWHQAGIVGRGDGSVNDVILDAQGVVIATFLWFVVQIFLDMIHYFSCPHPGRHNSATD